MNFIMLHRWLRCCITAAALFLLPSLAHAEPPVIVAFGDSLTSGLGVPVEQAYPARLERMLRAAGYPHRVINAGVSGDTTAGGVRRVEAVLALRPVLVIVELGANDGLRGIALPQIRANLDRILERLRAAGVPVVLAGMKLPPNYGPTYTDGFALMYAELARRHHVTLMPFFLDGVAARPELNQPDGLHPTAEGYGVIADRIWSALLPLLGKSDRGAPSTGLREQRYVDPAISSTPCVGGIGGDGSC
jgi:acyl-CoA thioesterase-1